MAQIETDRLFAFSAFWATSRADAKGQNQVRSALLYSRSGGARVARQRGSILPSCPILQPGNWSVTYRQPCAKGTFLLWKTGDISTLG